MRKLLMTIGVCLTVGTSAAYAQKVKVGVIVSTTGALASLGVPMKNAILLMPKNVEGTEIQYIVLDDASDTTTTRKHAEKLISEDKVDAIIGPSATPATLSIIDLVARNQTPMISLGAGLVIVEPMDDKKRWVFKTPFSDSTHALSTARHMQKSGVKKVAMIAINDAYGESWMNEFIKAAKSIDLPVEVVERYDRNDTSLFAQALKVMAVKPDAVLIAAGGTPGILPQSTLRERGYKGPIYQTTGITNNEFTRVGGSSVEGTLVSSGPFMVADDLPADHPVKEAAQALKKQFEEAYGDGTATAFTGIAWNAGLLLQNAIPKALSSGEPGTAEFRSALRETIENAGPVATVDGINEMSPTDHSGYGIDSAVFVTVKDGRWRLAQ